MSERAKPLSKAPPISDVRLCLDDLRYEETNHSPETTTGKAFGRAWQIMDWLVRDYLDSDRES